MARRIDTETPVADHVLKLLDAAKSTFSLVAACDLKLFDTLHRCKAPITVDDLVKENDWNGEPLRRLLDMVVSLQLVSKSSNGDGQDVYTNTDGGRLLMKDGPPVMYEYAMMVNDDVSTLSKFADSIRKAKPKPKDEAASAEPKPEGGEPKSENEGYSGSFPPEFWINIYRMCDGIAVPYARQVVTAINLSKHKKVVDLGGGSGAFSYALLDAYPDMNVVLAELPTALPVIIEHFVSKKPDPRLSTLAVDYSKDVLPKADLYVLGNVVHDHDHDGAKDLLNKVYAALNPGGGVFIIDQLLNDAKDGPPLAHAWDVAFCGMGQMYSGKEMAAVLEACNFMNVQIVKTQECCMSDIVYAIKH